MLCGYEGRTVCREGSEGRDSSRPWSPKNGGKGVDSELSMETVLAGFVSLYPPYNWIPAPRFHEDKLCGKDRRRTGTYTTGCADGRSPFAEGLGVSPNILVMSLRGAERRSNLRVG